MKRLIITGLMRSGTGLLAKLLHDEGVNMGTVIGAPAIPHADVEFEDPFLSTRLLYEDLTPRDVEVLFYSRSRALAQLHKIYGYQWKTMGFKSPFWLLHGEAIAKVPKKPFVIQMDRDETDRQRAMSRWMAGATEQTHRTFRNLDERLQQQCIDVDMVIGFRQLETQPRKMLDQILRAIETQEV